MNAFTELECKNCGSKLEFDQDRDLLICMHCATVYTKTEFAAKNATSPSPFPAGSLTQEKTDTDLSIVYRWFTLEAIAVLIFSFIWIGLLTAFAFGGVTAFIKNPPQQIPKFILLFPALILVLMTSYGVVMVYTALGMIFNKTRITVDQALLQIRTGPFPMQRRVKLDSHLIKQLYCKRKMRYSKNRSREIFQIDAILADQRECNLLKNLPTPDLALYIEQEVEKFLNLPNHSVPGEFR